MSTDKRLLDRSIRKGELDPEQVGKAVLETQDLADAIERPSDEELARLPEDLENEKRIRDERIEEAKNRPSTPPRPVAPVIPLDDEI